MFFDRFSSAEINNKTARDRGRFADKRAKTFRFTLDVEAGQAVAVEELLPKSDWEFPIINEGFKGKRYCFAYGYEFRSASNGSSTTTSSSDDNDQQHQPPEEGPISAPGPTGATGMANMAMIKYNMCGGVSHIDGKRKNQIFHRPYHYFSEPWFVPRPGGTKEDDGVVLALALDGAAKKGVLFVLDAETLRVLARLRLPVLVNLKTHGRFIQKMPSTVAASSS